jgi:hypothetical protein
MADAHHNTAEGDEGGGGESEFFGTEEGSDRDVSSGFELSVGFDDNAAAEVDRSVKMFSSHQLIGSSNEHE